MCGEKGTWQFIFSCLCPMPFQSPHFTLVSLLGWRKMKRLLLRLGPQRVPNGILSFKVHLVSVHLWKPSKDFNLKQTDSTGTSLEQLSVWAQAIHTMNRHHDDTENNHFWSWGKSYPLINISNFRFTGRL